MKLGLVVAVEMDAVDRKYGKPVEYIKKNYQIIRKYNRYNSEIYVINCGAGPIAAASATQLLICEFKPDFIVNFGVVGALTQKASYKRLYLVESVVDYNFDTSSADGCEVGRHLEYPVVNIPLSKELISLSQKIIGDIPLTVCASGAKFIATKEEKNQIYNEFGADIVDMESAGIVLTCDRNKIPCLIVKMVADGIDGGVEEFKREFQRSSDNCMNLLDKIIKELS